MPAGGGGWTVDPSALAQLRMDQAVEALQRGDVDLALIEAEELLDEHPDHLDALYLVGDASLRHGDAPVAESAFRRFLELEPASPGALVGLAAARFELADLAGTIAATSQATLQDPAMAEAWYYTGLALERLGQPVEARAAHARATQLEPVGYPPVGEVDSATWQAALAFAMQLLPEAIVAWLADVPVVSERFPSIAVIAAMNPPLSPMVWCLYDGSAPEGAEPSEAKPTALRLFKGNLERVAAIEGDLPRRIAEALRHEVLDWLNMGLDELPLKADQGP
jgi:tetratricopeptide (TPR) repeat protein